MGYSQHVGRIGSLAVALGIGTAMVTWPAVAIAGPDEGSDAPNTPASQSGPGEGGADVGVKTPNQSDADAGGPAIFRHNPLTKILTGLAGIPAQTTRGATAHVAGDATPRKRKDPDPSSGEANISVARVETNDASPATHQTDAPKPTVFRSFVQPKPVTPAAVSDTAPVVASARTMLSPVSTDRVGGTAAALPRVPDAVAAPARLGLHIVTGVLAAALAPFASPSAPGDVPPSPTLFAILAWARREIRHDLFNQRPTLVAYPQTAQGAGDVVTGRVTGTDADGDDLTYTASGGAEGSTVAVDDNGNWTYTAPAGAVGDTAYADSFTITVSDGDGHLHGLSGIFSPDGGHTASVNVAVSVAPDAIGPPPPPGDPDPVSGEVEGSLGVSGTQNNPLTITVVDPPKYGSLVLDPVTGNYVYTPNQAGRLKAAIAAAQGQTFTDSFTVSVAQGQAQPQTFARTAAFSTFAAAADDGNDITIEGIKIPGSTITEGPTIPVGDGPAGVVMTDRYAYVINSDLNGTNSTVTVIDIATGNVVGDPLPVGKQSILGAAKDDKVYVTNFNGSISVIDTNTNTLVDADGDPTNGVTPIEVGGFLTQAVADPDPTVHRLYVNSMSGVYVIDTENDTLVDVDGDAANGVTPIQLDPAGEGQSNALSFSADGKQMYVSAIRILGFTQPTDEEPGGYQLEGEVVVVDTDPASPTYNQVIGTDLAPDTVPSVSATSGDKLFVLDTPLNGVQITNNPGGSQTVTYPPGVVHVVDLADGSPTYGQVLYDVPVSSQAVYLTTSPDKSLVYVVSISDGTITVIDTAADNSADAVLDTFTYNSNQPGGAYNLIAVSNDGKYLYVSNLATDTVSTYTLA